MIQKVRVMAGTLLITARASMLLTVMIFPEFLVFILRKFGRSDSTSTLSNAAHWQKL